ncbi:hypothetical protein PRIPAC_82682 [Pristionchus pacificus]|uniref:Uncharacterized protein n=1 Tax=Pristionchus pacificus TaxID=54126 RepID=A0A2A6CLC4_PRIPA|nr:hypothetical protein PRIPAC_82682 [Pristionchus pacificus]|eukprot:PDM79002.1 hypothetical protein PRIPAC_31581 [Pristionchus pacificus]
MKTVLYMMRFICTVEGFSGFFLNVFLFRFLIRSTKKNTINKLFIVPIYVSALQGLYLCIAIAFMNFTHILYDGTLAIPLVGPSVQFIPKFWCDLLYEIAFVAMSFMWTLTPSTCILQYTALSRNFHTKWKRLLISFIPTVFCLILIAYTVPMTMPTPELSEIMGRTFKELYGMEQDEFLECYGITIKYAGINVGMKCEDTETPLHSRTKKAY